MTSPAAKRCGGVHGTHPATIAILTPQLQSELRQFRKAFGSENPPQEVFVVGVGEKTSSLIATLQTLSSDYAVNLPLKLPARVRELNDLSREDLSKITDYLDSKLPRLRQLSHRTLLLIDTGRSAESLSLLREVFERHYRQYGLRVYIETRELTAKASSPEQFAISNELAREIQNGALSKVREHEAFNPADQKFLDQAPSLPRDADYEGIARAIRDQLSFTRAEYSP